jgi:hypothetical protein
MQRLYECMRRNENAVRRLGEEVRALRRDMGRGCVVRFGSGEEEEEKDRWSLAREKEELQMEEVEASGDSDARVQALGRLEGGERNGKGRMFAVLRDEAEVNEEGEGEGVEAEVEEEEVEEQVEEELEGGKLVVLRDGAADDEQAPPSTSRPWREKKQHQLREAQTPGLSAARLQALGRAAAAEGGTPWFVGRAAVLKRRHPEVGLFSPAAPLYSQRYGLPPRPAPSPEVLMSVRASPSPLRRGSSNERARLAAEASPLRRISTSPRPNMGVRPADQVAPSPWRIERRVYGFGRTMTRPPLRELRVDGKDEEAQADENNDRGEMHGDTTEEEISDQEDDQEARHSGHQMGSGEAKEDHERGEETEGHSESDDDHVDIVECCTVKTPSIKDGENKENIPPSPTTTSNLEVSGPISSTTNNNNRVSTEQEIPSSIRHLNGSFQSTLTPIAEEHTPKPTLRKPSNLTQLNPPHPLYFTPLPSPVKHLPSQALQVNLGQGKPLDASIILQPPTPHLRRLTTTNTMSENESQTPRIPPVASTPPPDSARADLLKTPPVFRTLTVPNSSGKKRPGESLSKTPTSTLASRTKSADIANCLGRETPARVTRCSEHHL